MLDLEISTAEDWPKFRSRQFAFDTILDPMIFRTADVFLRGRTEAERSQGAAKAWAAISQNIGSLFAFFDSIILCQRLPLIDYGHTFDRHLGFGHSATEELPLIKLCNEGLEEKLLYNVHVDGAAYLHTKTAAMQLLRDHPPIAPQLRDDIQRELSGFDYDWQPILPMDRPIADEDRLLQSYLFNGLLFSAYAQATECDHIIQPKRAGLLLCLSLPEAPAARPAFEEALFRSLKQIANATPDGLKRTVEMPAAPTFLPYLLSFGDQTPGDLLRRALGMRQDPAVVQYRGWWQQTRQEWKQGRFVMARAQEVDDLAQVVARQIKAEERPTTLTLSVTDVSVEHELFLHRIWGWAVRQLPGKRYRKLLMRLALAQREYVQIDRHLEQIWKTP